jgi:ankyrin repeat protein
MIGYTPLHTAVESRYWSNAVYFLNAGADIDAQTAERRTALSISLYDMSGLPCLLMVKQLLDRNARTDTKFRSEERVSDVLEKSTFYDFFDPSKEHVGDAEALMKEIGHLVA